MLDLKLEISSSLLPKPYLYMIPYAQLHVDRLLESSTEEANVAIPVEG